MKDFYNMDCMEGMKEYPDNYFDLAIVDPPYGAGFTEGGGCKGWFTKYHQTLDTKNKELGVHFHGRGRSKKYLEPFANETRFGSKDSRFEKYKRNGIIGWDEAPPQEYFEELFRISKNQIIWGGELLPVTAYKMLSCLEKTHHIGELHNGNGRIRMDEFQ